MKNRPSCFLAFVVSIAALCSQAPSAATAETLATERKPVTDEYDGVKVTDDYRWLENPSDPAVKAWSAQENRLARAYLDALPDRAAIGKQLTELYSKDTPGYGSVIPRPNRIFALKFQPTKQQPTLVSLASADDLASEKVIFDPSEASKGNVAIDWFSPSQDGSLIAVSTSLDGTENGMLFFYRTDTGETLDDIIPRVQYPTAGGSVAWAPDGKSVFYTRYPHAGEKPEADLSFYQQIYTHKLGDPESADVYSLGKDFPRIAEVELSTSRDGRWLVASVANGDGGEFAHYVRDLKKGDAAVWRQVTHFEDKVKEVVPGCDGLSLYLRSVKDAPRGKILRMALDDGATLKDARLIVPESEDVIEGMAPTASYLFVSELAGGPSKLRRFDLDGANGIEVPIPPNSGVQGIAPLRNTPEDNRILYRQTSYIEPAAWYAYDPAIGKDKVTKTALAKKSPADFSDIEAVREFVTSKDGTKIPINILRSKPAQQTGSHPALLYAYGGYGISERPEFNFTDRLWFDRGGIYVVANVRGGGEYGEEWHLAGNLTKKQNVFDDFAACALHLIERGYTTSEKLAVEGGSNGGLLMGAFLTQHPDLARAVVSHVGMYDMLRMELEPNGAFNVTEFGSVKDPAQFKALHAYSPYHHVTDGAKYPAVFFLTGENDGRVNPANSRKMTARLQAATTSGHPILLRQNSGSGHGMGTALSERIAQKADVFAFLFDQLGMKSNLRAFESAPVNAVQDFDLQGFIDGAIKSGSKRIIVPPGRYRVTPKNGRHLVFKDLANLEIIADGVEMVCTQTVQAIQFEHCHDLHFKGLTVDYDPLPYTEARITALAPDKSWVEFQIIDGYPDNSLEERIEIYDPSTRELRSETTGWSKEFESLGSHRYRASKHAGYHFSEKTDTEQVGDILVTNNAFPAKAGGHAIVLSKCAGVKIEDVTVYASPCFGFLEGDCDATTYLCCKIDRRTPQDDPIARGFPRMRSLDADAFHSGEAIKGPAILDCTAKFQGDDCVNIHGTYHLVTASEGRTLRVATLRHMTIAPGDPVEFLPYSGVRPADAVAVSIEPDAGITDDEKAFVRRVSLNEHNRQTLLEGKATFYKIALDREVPLAMGAAVCSGKRVGNGFAVKGCDFGYNRSRGILIKASHGEVTGNRITHGWMAAVLIAPEFWWFEAASSSDVTIQDNVITGCRRPAIEIIAPGGDGKPLPSGAHRDLRILNNTILESVWPNIRATSTAGLILTSNHLTPSDPEIFIPPQPSRWNWRTTQPSALSIELCEPPPAP